MQDKPVQNFFNIGVAVFLGLFVLGFSLNTAVKSFKAYERTVTVKGLAEREYPADIVIWPIQFSVANNDLTELYKTIAQQTEVIRSFLLLNGIAEQEITIAPITVNDKLAQRYGNINPNEIRYTAEQKITVYSPNVDTVRNTMSLISELGQEQIVLTGAQYQNQTQYLFTRLNEIKPDMVEEATVNAREVAQRFAQDSKSQLGKIKNARQGQFSITGRDTNNPHIKKVRVVSTIEYYLID